MIMVVVMMAVIMVMMVMTMAVVAMSVTMTVLMIMVVMVDALVRATALWAFAEDERLDGDWYGVGGHADAAEIDVIEVAQHHAVDRKNFAVDQKLLAQDRAECLGDIAIEHDVDRLFPLDGVGEPMPDAFREGRNALIGWRPLPAQCQGDLALAFDQIEGGEVRFDRFGECRGIDDVLALVGGLQHLQIPSWQQLAWLGDVAGIAGELNAVFGSAERGGSDALAGGEQRPGQCTLVDLTPDRLTQPATHVAEIAGLTAIDIFADAAREHDAVDPAELENRIGEIEMRDRGRHRPLGERRHGRVRHHVGDLVEQLSVDHIALVPVKAGLPRMISPARNESHDRALVAD